MRTNKRKTAVHRRIKERHEPDNNKKRRTGRGGGGGRFLIGHAMAIDSRGRTLTMTRQSTMPGFRRPRLRFTRRILALAITHVVLPQTDCHGFIGHRRQSLGAQSASVPMLQDTTGDCDLPAHAEKTPRHTQRIQWRVCEAFGGVVRSCNRETYGHESYCRRASKTTQYTTRLSSGCDMSSRRPAV